MLPEIPIVSHFRTHVDIALKIYSLGHELRTPNEGINQRYLKSWADVADKICFGRTWKWMILHHRKHSNFPLAVFTEFDIGLDHGLRTLREEKAFTARPKIHSHSQIFRYGRSIFCLPLRPNFSDIFDLCLHWVSVVRDKNALQSHPKILNAS